MDMEASIDGSKDGIATMREEVNALKAGLVAGTIGQRTLASQAISELVKGVCGEQACLADGEGMVLERPLSDTEMPIGGTKDRVAMMGEEVTVDNVQHQCGA